MKRFSIILICFCLLIFTSCGNLNLGLGEFHFSHVHIFNPDGTDACLTIVSWRECDVGVEVRTEEYGAIWISEGCYILCEGECPICGGS